MIYYLFFSVFVIDRFLKFLILINFKVGDRMPVLPFLDITYLKNTGIAFSFFRGNNTALIWTNILVIAFLLFLLLTDKTHKKPVYTAYGFILGGALSNLWDRFFYGGVIDYIDLKVFPVFNVADTSISVGAVIIGLGVLCEYLPWKKRTG
ncbi:MAG: signal peptidase II [Elusimicrobia bacterium]|nr:signal peptidase II [Elusimicrobiota bacterium]